MAARRVIVVLCGLAIVFGALTVAVKQYALIWWAACFIAALVAIIVVLANRNSTRSGVLGAFLVAGVGILAALVGVFLGSR